MTLGFYCSDCKLTSPGMTKCPRCGKSREPLPQVRGEIDITPAKHESKKLEYKEDEDYAS